jgi:uncharacterized protein YjiS (DUF1127 family)
MLPTTAHRVDQTRSNAMTNAIFNDAIAGAPHVRAPSQPGLVRRLLGRLHRAVRISTMRSELQQIPDHLLKDIGVSRSEIDSIVAVVDGTVDCTRHARSRN